MVGFLFRASAPNGKYTLWLAPSLPLRCQEKHLGGMILPIPDSPYFTKINCTELHRSPDIAAGGCLGTRDCRVP